MQKRVDFFKQILNSAFFSKRVTFQAFEESLRLTSFLHRTNAPQNVAFKDKRCFKSSDSANLKDGSGVAQTAFYFQSNKRLFIFIRAIGRVDRNRIIKINYLMAFCVFML